MAGKKLIYPVISLCILLACLISTTVAWVTINRQVSSNNSKMTIQAVSDVATLSCYALRYDGTIGTACYKIGEDSEHGEVLDVEMTEFDRIFRDRSINTPLIYVIELANVPDAEGYKINIKVPCSQKFIKLEDNSTVNEFEDDGNVDKDEYSIERYISNVISVKVGCGGAITPLTATTTNRIENNVNVFSTQQTAFRSVTSGERVGRFASVTTTGEGNNAVTTYSKDNAVFVSLSQSDYHDSLYTVDDGEGEDTGNHLMLYIQFDYDEGLMDSFIDHMYDDSDGHVSFDDDLGVIQVLVKRSAN